MAKRVSGQRRYDAGTLKQVGSIQAAQRAGVSLEEIKTLMDSSRRQSSYADCLQELARRKVKEVETRIARAQAMKAALEAATVCRGPRLDACPLFVNEH